MHNEGDPIRLPERTDPHLARFRGEIFSGLELGRGGNQGVEAAHIVANDIAQGVWFASLRLGIPYPTYRLIHSWDEIAPADSRGRIVLANITHFKDKPSAMGFSPDYLSCAIDYYSFGAELALGYPTPRELAMHEMRHIWQHISFPELLNRDLEIYAQQGLDGWIETESEKDAFDFSINSEGELALNGGNLNGCISTEPNLQVQPAF